MLEPILQKYEVTFEDRKEVLQLIKGQHSIYYQRDVFNLQNEKIGYNRILCPVSDDFARKIYELEKSKFDRMFEEQYYKKNG